MTLYIHMKMIRSLKLNGCTLSSFIIFWTRGAEVLCVLGTSSTRTRLVSRRCHWVHETLGWRQNGKLSSVPTFLPIVDAVDIFPIRQNTGSLKTCAFDCNCLWIPWSSRRYDLHGILSDPSVVSDRNVLLDGWIWLCTVVKMFRGDCVVTNTSRIGPILVLSPKTPFGKIGTHHEGECIFRHELTLKGGVRSLGSTVWIFLLFGYFIYIHIHIFVFEYVFDFIFLTAIAARVLVTFLVKKTIFRAVSENAPLRPLFLMFFFSYFSFWFVHFFNFSPFFFFFTRVSFHFLFSCCFFVLAFLVNFSVKEGTNGSLSEKQWKMEINAERFLTFGKVDRYRDHGRSRHEQSFWVCTVYSWR